MATDARRSRIAFTSIAAAFLLLVAAGIFVLDAPIAAWAASHPRNGDTWTSWPAMLDMLALRQTSRFAIGTILLIAGGVLLPLRFSRPIGWAVLYVGAVQFASTAIAHLLQPLFGRQGPLDAVSGPSALTSWFVGGMSFPDEHTAFFAGLFFPLMVIKPRWTFLFAIPPLFIAASGMITRAHYFSDSAASLAIAALAAGGLAFVHERADL